MLVSWTRMQHAIERDERPGESQEALDGKNKLVSWTRQEGTWRMGLGGMLGHQPCIPR